MSLAVDLLVLQRIRMPPAVKGQAAANILKDDSEFINSLPGLHCLPLR